MRAFLPENIKLFKITFKAGVLLKVSTKMMRREAKTFFFSFRYQIILIKTLITKDIKG